jgi:hypothetical protein
VVQRREGSGNGQGGRGIKEGRGGMERGMERESVAAMRT